MNIFRIALPAATLCALVATFGVNAQEDEKCKNHYILHCPVHVVAETQTAVEYYYYPWDFYFVTSFPDEIAALDAQGSWQRTTQTFSVWPKPNALASPTCRFFSTAFAPKSTHFYTPFPDECAIVKNEPAWQFESIAFYIALADGNGLCGGGTMPLYRAYNNGMGGAPNHRYTTRLSILNQMLAAGWVFEGDGKTKVFACVPQGAPSAAEGLWFGYYDDTRGVVLDTGEYYFVTVDNPTVDYPTSVIETYLHGSSTSVNGTFYSNESHLTVFGADNPNRHAQVQGTYVAGTSISIKAVRNDEYNFSLNATYQPVYAQPISLATVAGNYIGLVAVGLSLSQNAQLTVASNGALSGLAGGCTLTGTVAPYRSVNVLDATITFGGVGCVLGTETLAGIAFYDAPRSMLHVAASGAPRGIEFVFRGAK